MTAVRVLLPTSISFITLLIAGYILESFAGDVKTQYIGFLIIFTLALLSMIVSFMYLCAKYEPQYVHFEDNKTGFIDFLKNAGSRNYGMFIIFVCLMNFSIFIAAPFFAGYMLYDLKLSYTEYTILIAAAVKFYESQFKFEAQLIQQGVPLDRFDQIPDYGIGPYHTYKKIKRILANE